MERAIETKKRVTTYGTGRGKVEALKGIDLAVNKGELLAVIGAQRLGDDYTLDGWRQHL